jgi:anthranilate phosphoribosyltransferase
MKKSMMIKPKNNAFIPYLKAVGRGAKLKRDLTTGEAKEAMSLILTRQATLVQIGGFLIAHRVKGESADEVIGFTQAARASCRQIHPNVENLMDLGLPYDGKAKTPQLGPVIALVLAAAGQPVVFHGDLNVPTKYGVGPLELLEALGVEPDQPLDVVKRNIERMGIGFLYAPRFAPDWHALMPVRQQFGLRTVLNTVEKLLNPANAPITVVGFFHKNYLIRMLDVVHHFTPKGWLIQGVEGSIESPPGRATSFLPADPEATPFIIDSPSLGFPRHAQIQAPPDPMFHAQIARGVLANQPSSARDTVLLSAGMLLFIAGRVGSQKEGVELAHKVLANGSANRLLQRFIF